METLTIEQLENQGTLRLTRGEIMKSDANISDRAPVLRPSDVVHNRTPERLSDEYDEPLPVRYPTARINEVAVCLHFSPGSTCLITESFDGSIPTRGIVLVSVKESSTCDSTYLKTWLLSGVLETELKRLQIGSHMATVKMSDLRQVRVPIPDVETQKKLVKAVIDARESVVLHNDLAHQTNRLLQLQNDLFITNLAELHNS